MMPILPRTHTIPKTNSSLTWEMSQVRQVELQGPKGTGLGKQMVGALAQRPHPLPQVLGTQHSPLPGHICRELGICLPVASRVLS